MEKYVRMAENMGALHALLVDVFSTVRRFGLPIEVLTDREQRQNRYAFVFIA